MTSTILLTGVTGFIGSHITIQLLNKGYKVRGTLRNMERANEMREVIGKHTDSIDNLSFFEANLLDKEVWKKATEGVDYVMHVASPFPRTLPKREEDLIRPAVDGTLNVLRAASENGVKKVVLTSSTGAIVYGKQRDQRKGTFNEEDWTDVTNKKDSTPYFRSKTLAERAAWDFMETDTSGMHLSVICPGAVLGPVLEKDFGTSANIVIKTMDGSAPAVPGIGFDCVDVRSIADLHIRALESQEANGQRFAGTNGYLEFKEVADVLREAYPDRKIPKAKLPDFAVRIFSMIDASVKPILVDLGAERRLDNSKAKQMLGWNPIDVREAVKATAQSVVKQGLV